MKDAMVYLKISSAIEEVTHVIVSHSDAFLDEVGLVVVQLVLKSFMPLCCFALFLLNQGPAVPGTMKGAQCEGGATGKLRLVLPVDCIAS